MIVQKWWSGYFCLMYQCSQHFLTYIILVILLRFLQSRPFLYTADGRLDWARVTFLRVSRQREARFELGISCLTVQFLWHYTTGALTNCSRSVHKDKENNVKPLNYCTKTKMLDAWLTLSWLRANSHTKLGMCCTSFASLIFLFNSDEHFTTLPNVSEIFSLYNQKSQVVKFTLNWIPLLAAGARACVCGYICTNLNASPMNMESSLI